MPHKDSTKKTKKVDNTAPRKKRINFSALGCTSCNLLLLDSESLSEIHLVCKHWASVLFTDSTFQRLTLNRYPELKSIPLQFQPNDIIDSWRHFYMLRLQRDEFINFEPEFSAYQLKKTQWNFKILMKKMKRIKDFGEMASLFPKQKMGHELSILADTVLYSKLYITHKLSAYETCYDEWEIDGGIIGLDGKIHGFFYQHKLSFDAHEAYNDIGPRLAIGGLPIILGESEELVEYVQKVHKLLNLKNTTQPELWHFINSYIKPPKSVRNKPDYDLDFQEQY